MALSILETLSVPLRLMIHRSYGPSRHGDAKGRKGVAEPLTSPSELRERRRRRRENTHGSLTTGEFPYLGEKVEKISATEERVPNKRNKTRNAYYSIYLFIYLATYFPNIETPHPTNTILLQNHSIKRFPATPFPLPPTHPSHLSDLLSLYKSLTPRPKLLHEEEPTADTLTGTAKTSVSRKLNATARNGEVQVSRGSVCRSSSFRKFEIDKLNVIRDGSFWGSWIRGLKI